MSKFQVDTQTLQQRAIGDRTTIATRHRPRIKNRFLLFFFIRCRFLQEYRSNRLQGIWASWKFGMDVKQKTQIFENLASFARKFIFGILSMAAIPNHIAFIMDGNRRYSKQHNLINGAGHRVGFSSLMSMLRYCYELGVKYVTIYAFSIENFKRSPEEVQSLMDLMEEKIEGLIKEESIVNQYGVRVYFIGNLKLLSKPVRLAAERAMDATAKNSKAVLSICIAYTSTDEILHAVEESCEEIWDKIKVLDDCGSGYGLIKLGNERNQEKNIIDVSDIERHMYMAVAPDPDIIIRTSG
ncbi:hypothetical protein L6452_13788 [Arctium lappa]|uniref:Uncharacterized protein n=1 Tax=Arctium lappa TaxID=4217 RepID=A0ACB9CJL2_ARCLA|nr:hypothetical protein L6452_13788 [Arctium lappa]